MTTAKNTTHTGDTDHPKISVAILQVLYDTIYCQTDYKSYERLVTLQIEWDTQRQI